jgi:hypothetical protein
MTPNARPLSYMSRLFDPALSFRHWCCGQLHLEFVVPCKISCGIYLLCCDKLPVSSCFAAGKDIDPIVLHQLVNLMNLLMSCVALGKQTEA